MLALSNSLEKYISPVMHAIITNGGAGVIFFGFKQIQAPLVL